MTLGRQCDFCSSYSSRAARYCQWCGRQIRPLEPFESPNQPSHRLLPFDELQGMFRSRQRETTIEDIKRQSEFHIRRKRADALERILEERRGAKNQHPYQRGIDQ
ncbi:hypothetical protein KY092_11435 [Natronomonas gomsonensis]|uniref:hypothetical protein n=1 Tax=Natronomonas gomsonensis TaxID=1046043 RepID=UPI0020CA2BE8|nr:hypothetical protein [Natronomonas gomsonensis]MCY4731167.1 hypothetical protein [Natronomonas gomsonensis]